MSHTVIIPSKTARNLDASLAGICKNDPVADVIVIDDGIEWQDMRTICLDGDFSVIDGEKPFVYARNCNLGIKACAGDVILLNDDAVLETPRGFDLLEQASREHPELGIISAVTDVVGNPEQRPRGRGLREPSDRSIAFVCVYIPRRTIEEIGMLDERFTAYGWEDNDYVRRVRLHGLRIGILDDCFVNHSSLRSSFRGLPHTAADISAGREIYVRKWGDAR